MSEIADFIEAQYQRIERVALMAAETGGPHWPNSDTEMWTNELVHTRLHDSAFVLADIAAKRRILDEVVDEATCLDMQVDGDRRVGPRDTVTEPYLGDILLRLLAAPFSGEPGYKETWAV